MTPETLALGNILIGIGLGALGVGVMWLVQSERMGQEKRQLARTAKSAQQNSADLAVIAATIIEDNIGLAVELDRANERLSMALDVEILSSPDTTVVFIPQQRTSPDVYDHTKDGL